MKNKDKIYSIGCCLLIIDQIVKLIIRSNMDIYSEIEIIPNFFSIYYVINDGAAFSILGGARIFLILISLGVLIVLDKYINKEKEFSNLGIISLGIIIGGVIGNLIDRILYSGVIDYLSFNIFSYNAPIFNIADIGITVGALLFVIDVVRRDYYENKSRRRKKIKNR